MTTQDLGAYFNDMAYIDILSAVLHAPPGCSECVAFCQEGHISCECRGDFHPKTCEHSSCYEESEE